MSSSPSPLFGKPSNSSSEEPREPSPKEWLETSPPEVFERDTVGEQFGREIHRLVGVYGDKVKVCLGENGYVMMNFRDISKKVEVVDESAALVIRLNSSGPILQVEPDYGVADAKDLLSQIEPMATPTKSGWLVDLVRQAGKSLITIEGKDVAADKSVDSQLSAESCRYQSDFEELQLLGEGGYGAVMKCRHKLDDNEYAVKKVALTNRIWAKPHEKEKLLREVKALGKLQHKHIVSYYQAWIDTDVSWLEKVTESGQFVAMKDAKATLCIQMELCTKTLEAKMKEDEHEKISETERWRYFREIVEGLAHIHSHRIIHRDLSMKNILLDASDKIKIVDFGLAKFLPSGEVSPVAGSIWKGNKTIYLAPEMMEKYPKISRKVDIYSLSWIFFNIMNPIVNEAERSMVYQRIRSGEGELEKMLSEGEVQGLADDKVRELFSSMNSRHAHKRPSAAEILNKDLPWHKSLEKTVEDLKEQNSELQEKNRALQKIIDDLKAAQIADMEEEDDDKVEPVRLKDSD